MGLIVDLVLFVMNLTVSALLVVGVYAAAHALLARALSVRGMPIFGFTTSHEFGATGARRWAVRLGALLAAYLAMLPLCAAMAPTHAYDARVEVMPTGAAAKAGVKDGDRVIRAADVPIHTFTDLAEQVRSHPSTLPLVVERGTEQRSFDVHPDRGLIGLRAAGSQVAVPGPSAATLLVRPLRIGVGALRLVGSRLRGGPTPAVYLSFSPAEAGTEASRGVVLIWMILNWAALIFAVLAGWVLISTGLLARRRALVA